MWEPTPLQRQHVTEAAQWFRDTLPELWSLDTRIAGRSLNSTLRIQRRDSEDYALYRKTMEQGREHFGKARMREYFADFFCFPADHDLSKLWDGEQLTTTTSG